MDTTLIPDDATAFVPVPEEDLRTVLICARPDGGYEVARPKPKTQQLPFVKLYEADTKTDPEAALLWGYFHPRVLALQALGTGDHAGLGTVYKDPRLMRLDIPKQALFCLIEDEV